MAKVARAAKSRPAVAPVVKATSSLVLGGWLFAAALVCGFIVYSPALSGDFVFDDRGLPMFYTNAIALPLRAWVHVRPLLMATFYANYHVSGLDPEGYHAVNVALHCACSVLLFFVLRRLLQWVNADPFKRTDVAIFGAALFLLHPVQTEAVSYVASRSENLSVLFFLLAWLAFLYRPHPQIDWKTTAFILVLYGCAMSCKEHTAVLPAVLLMTDYFFNPGFSLTGIKNNWRLYGPIALAAVAGLIYFSTYIVSDSNLGFGMKGLSWWDYLLTQFRAIWVYLRLVILPYGQSVDYNFPISHSLIDRGSVLYGLALVALIAAAIRYRKQIPLASFGFLAALILFAPTSSILPIKDTLVERRLYLPFLGVAVIACEGALRLPLTRKQLGVVTASICALLAVLTYQRNTKWTGMEALWQDAVSKDPSNARALMGLADGFALKNRCADAIPFFRRAAQLVPNDYRNTYNLASAYDCVNQPAAAEAGYRRALAIKQSSDSWAHIAMLQMKLGKFDDARHSLDEAQRLDGSYLLTYTYRGILDLAFNDFNAAEAQFRRVLQDDPANELALRGVDRALKHERQF